MMQRWTVVLLLGTSLAACQVDRGQVGSEVIEQAQFADACQATLPQPTIFDPSKPLPTQSSGQIWVIVPIQDLQMAAALVDTQKATIPNLIIIPKNERGGFVNNLDLTSLAVFPGHPPPPPPVIPDPRLLVFYGQNTIAGFQQSQIDFKSCPATPAGK